MALVDHFTPSFSTSAAVLNYTTDPTDADWADLLSFLAPLAEQQANTVPDWTLALSDAPAHLSASANSQALRPNTSLMNPESMTSTQEHKNSYYNLQYEESLNVHANLCNSWSPDAVSSSPSLSTSSISSKRARSDDTGSDASLLLQTSPSSSFSSSPETRTYKRQAHLGGSSAAPLSSYQSLVLQDRNENLNDERYKNQQKVERTIASLAQMRSRALEDMLETFIHNKRRSRRR